MTHKKVQFDLPEGVNLIKNTNSDWVTLTKDKIKIIIHDVEEQFRNKDSWVTPVSLTISLGTTLLTSNFHDFIVSKEMWGLIFGLATIVSIICSVQEIIKSVKARKSLKRKSLADYILTKMKENSETH